MVILVKLYIKGYVLTTIALNRTAAIKFRNGTIIDVVKVPGTKAYIQAMKALAKDAIRVRAGEESQL
jgi:hypothetical protein